MFFLLQSTVKYQLSAPIAPRIPPLAWIAIAIIVIFTLAVNIAMVALLREKTRPDQAKRQPKSGGFVGTAQNLAKMGEVMRDPFAKQRTQIDELSKLVHSLDEHTLNNGSTQAESSQDPSKSKEN